MDKNLNASIMHIYDSMTEEQKSKANACKTMADLISLAGKEGIELTDDVLDAAAGGCMFRLPYIGEDGKPAGSRGVDYGFIDAPTIVKREINTTDITVNTGDTGDSDTLILW